MTSIWEPPGLPLAPESKGNSHHIGWKNGKREIVNSPEAVAFKTTAITWFKTYRPDEPFDAQDKLALIVMVQYPDYKKDPDMELVADAIEKAGVIVNDRQFRDKRIIAVDEVGDPMTWVRVEKIGQLPWQSKAKGSR